MGDSDNERHTHLPYTSAAYIASAKLFLALAALDQNLLASLAMAIISTGPSFISFGYISLALLMLGKVYVVDNRLTV